MDASVHYFNGQYLPKEEVRLSIDDVGLIRGYAVFDFFKVKGTIPIFIDDHLSRLEFSAQQINLAIPLGRDELKAVVNELVLKNGFEYSSIKIIVTGGVSIDGFTAGEPQIIVLNTAFSDPPSALYAAGASLMLQEYSRDNPLVKSTNYTNALAAQSRWQSEGHIDVLYHQNGLVSEVSRSNIYYFKAGVLNTNDEGVLKGVTRKNVLKCAKNVFKVNLGPINLEELWSADEVFITSSTKKVLPIVKIGDREINDGQVGENTMKLITLFDQYIEDYLKLRS
ncbi:aminotransferase class IV [Roseivirga sp.]|uniref:aminotransferase class IV n=1 Tax=Roseivirga sp. TaxID=1964215 RepID=UPI003B8CFD97